MEKNSQIKTRQMPFMKQITKFSSRQYFPLYGIPFDVNNIHVCTRFPISVDTCSMVLPYGQLTQLYSIAHTQFITV